MKYALSFSVFILLLSCKEKKENFSYRTSIASKVYEAQIKYLDNTIRNYGEITDFGNRHLQENEFLDDMAESFKQKIRQGSQITATDRKNFFDHFEKMFTYYPLVDKEIFNELKEISIRSVSDVDMLRVYIKNNFVCILLNNKLLPYNAWSTMAFPQSSTINNGEEFEVSLANIAWNRDFPHEFFLVKDKEKGLIKENIVDTIHQEIDGRYYYKTKKYKKGENKLIFISRLNTPVSSDTLPCSVSFYVK